MLLFKKGEEASYFAENGLLPVMTARNMVTVTGHHTVTEILLKWPKVQQKQMQGQETNATYNTQEPIDGL